VRVLLMMILKSFVLNDGGVTSIEYALIALLIVLVIVVTITVVGQKTETLYQNVADAFP